MTMSERRRIVERLHAIGYAVLRGTVTDAELWEAAILEARLIKEAR